MLEKSGAVVYSNQLLIRNGQQAVLTLIPAGGKNEYSLITNNTGKHSLSVFNTNGQVVKQVNLSGNSSNLINFNMLPNGIYSVLVQSADRKETVRLFIHQ